MLLPIVLAPLLFSAQLASSSSSEQNVLHEDRSPYTRFSHPIRRVAVIGAGPAGLQSAAVLREQGFEVRLFERADKPGGNWYYSPLTPLSVPFP